MTLLIVVGGLAVWLLLALLVAVPLGRAIDRHQGTSRPPLHLSARGRWVAAVAAAVLLAIAVALATRGHVITWDGAVAVSGPDGAR